MGEQGQGVRPEGQLAPTIKSVQAISYVFNSCLRPLYKDRSQFLLWKTPVARPCC